MIGHRPGKFFDSSRAGFFAGAALVAAVWFSYRGILNAPFVFDDRPAILRNPTIARLWPLSVPFSPPADGSTVTGRPLLNFSFALNHALSGEKVWSYHLFNLALHALAALALFGILRRTRGFGGGTPLAWAAALLWAVHPLLTESVTCVAQRSETMMGVFYLLTLYGFIRYAEVERVDPNALSGGGVAQRVGVNALHPWAVLSVISCFLGMATKEAMVTAPVMVLLYDRTFVAGSFAAAWRTRRSYYLALASSWILLALLLARTGGSRGDAAGFGFGVTPWAYAVTQCWAIAHYLRLAFWPHPLILDYGMALARPGEVLPQAFLLALLLAGTAWALARRPALGFLGAWFFVILAPSSSVVPLVTQPVAEHRMYLPLAAIVAAAVWALRRVGPRRGLTLALGLAAAGMAATVRRNFDYRDEIAIWSVTADQVPNNARVRHELGYVLLNHGRVEEAMAQIRKSLALEPSARAENDLGNGWRKLGRLPEAIAAYEAAVRMNPADADIRFNLALALAEAGQVAGADREFQQALKLRPDFPDAEWRYGNLLYGRGRFDEAIAQFQAALRHRENFPAAHYNLGIAWEGAGRAEEAMREYRRALEQRPDYAEAHNNLGIALARAGRPAEAVAELEAALRADPGYAPARENLERLRRGPGR